MYEGDYSRSADCHYGDHDWSGGYCKWCGDFNAALLAYARFDKAEKEGRSHGDHFHLTVENAKKCEEKFAKQKHWYYITEYDCPQCMRTRVYKERRDGPKPIQWEERHNYVEAWDYCEI